VPAPVKFDEARLPKKMGARSPVRGLEIEHAFVFICTESTKCRQSVGVVRHDYHAAIDEIIINYSGTLERFAGDGGFRTGRLRKLF
jgi:hypothetical protein